MDIDAPVLTWMSRLQNQIRSSEGASKYSLFPVKIHQSNHIKIIHGCEMNKLQFFRKIKL